MLYRFNRGKVTFIRKIIKYTQGVSGCERACKTSLNVTLNSALRGRAQPNRTCRKFRNACTFTCKTSRATSGGVYHGHPQDETIRKFASRLCFIIRALRTNTQIQDQHLQRRIASTSVDDANSGWPTIKLAFSVSDRQFFFFLILQMITMSHLQLRDTMYKENRASSLLISQFNL